MTKQSLRTEVLESHRATGRQLGLRAPEVIDRDYAKCPDGRQRAHLGAAEIVALIADPHGFPIESAWQIETLRE